MTTSTLARDLHLAPAGVEVRKLTLEGCDAEVFVWDFPKTSALKGDYVMPLAKAFSGKSNKPVFFNSFRSVEQRDAFVQKWLADEVTSQAYKANRKAEAAAEKAALNAANDLPVGTVVYTSGGYDQTNVQFYEVVGHFGRLGVVLVAVGSKMTTKESGSMSGYVLPEKAVEGADQIKARLGRDGISIPGEYHHGFKHDGSPKYCSWYA